MDSSRSSPKSRHVAAADRGRADALRVVTPCSTVDEFVTMNRRFTNASALFVPTSEPLPVGTRRFFTVHLRNGDTVMCGACEIIEPPNPAIHPRSGMWLKLFSMDDASRAVHRRLLAPAPAAESARGSSSRSSVPNPPPRPVRISKAVAPSSRSTQKLSGTRPTPPPLPSGVARPQRPSPRQPPGMRPTPPPLPSGVAGPQRPAPRKPAATRPTPPPLPSGPPSAQRPSALKAPGTPSQPIAHSSAGPQRQRRFRPFNDVSDESVAQFLDRGLLQESPKEESCKDVAPTCDESAPISEPAPSTGGVALEIASRSGGAEFADTPMDATSDLSMNAKIAASHDRPRFALHAVDHGRELSRLPPRPRDLLRAGQRAAMLGVAALVLCGEYLPIARKPSAPSQVEAPRVVQPAAAPTGAPLALENPSARALDCIVTISTDPPGAIATWGDQALGATPVKEARVACGESTLVLDHPQFTRVEKRAAASSSSPVSLTEKLIRPRVKLELTATPSDVLFIVNGKDIGRPPTSVEVAGFTSPVVTAVRTGYKRWTRTIAVERDPMQVHADMERQPITKAKPEPDSEPSAPTETPEHVGDAPSE